MSLYAIPETTKASLSGFGRKSRESGKPFQAKIYILDIKNRIIRAEDEGEVYDDLDSLTEDLPESSPRFIVLHWDLKQSDGRMKMTYSLLYWLPDNSNPTQRMSYASAVEAMRTAANTIRFFELKDTDEFKKLPERLA